jgi:hypothetical protein
VAGATRPSRSALPVQLAGTTGGPFITFLQRTAGNRATSNLLSGAVQGTHPLPFRREMEHTFQADLSDVRVTRGVKGLPIAGASHGRNILFAAQEPSLPLVAHEVAHALQSRRGLDRGRDAATIARSENAEREADVAGARAATGGVISVGASTPGGWQLRKGDYGKLKNPVTKAQTRQSAETKYRTEAADFEKRLGIWLAKSPDALGAARKLVFNIKITAAEYFRGLGENPDLTKVWGEDKKKITGAVAHTQKVIDKVLVKGNLREMLGLVYQAFTSGGLTRMLEQARTEIVAAAEKKKKVNTELNAARQNVATATTRAAEANVFQKALAFIKLVDDEDEALRLAIVARTNLEQEKTQAEAEETNVTDKWRLAGLSTGELTSEELEKKRAESPTQPGRAYFKRSELVATQDRKVAPKGTVYQPPTVGDVAGRDVPLSSRELKMAFPAQYAQAKTPVGKDQWKTLDEDTRRQAINVNTEQLKWKPGEHVYQLGPKLQKWGDDLGVLLMGGISGSTDTYLRAANYFGLSSLNDMQGMRLAALGSMIPARDHSFAEIMTAAREFGMRDYEPGPSGYRTIAPLAEDQILHGTGSPKFPDYWRSQDYLDELAENLLGSATETGTVAGTDVESLLGVAPHDPTTGAVDPLPADIRNLVTAVTAYDTKKKAAEAKESKDGRPAALDERAAQVADLTALMRACSTKVTELRAMTGGYDRTKQRQLEALHSVSEWAGNEYAKLGAKPGQFAKVKTSVIADLRAANKLPPAPVVTAANLRAGGFEAGPEDLALRVDAENAVAGKVELNIKKTNAVRNYLAERQRLGQSGQVTKAELNALPNDHELRSVFDFGRLVEVGGYLEDFIMDTATLEAVVRGRSVASAQDPGRAKADELTQARQAASTSVTLREMAAVHEYTKGTAWYSMLNDALSGKADLATMDEEQQRLVRLTVSGLHKMGKFYPFKETVYRGIKRMKDLFVNPTGSAAKIKSWALSNYPVGHTGHGAKILTSTSKRAETSFAAKDGYNVALEITKTRSGADITLLAQLAEAEREVLFPPGVRFKTVGHEFDLTGKRIGKPLLWVKQEEV